MKFLKTIINENEIINEKLKIGDKFEFESGVLTYYITDILWDGAVEATDTRQGDTYTFEKAEMEEAKKVRK
jgi:hypothetical protein